MTTQITKPVPWYINIQKEDYDDNHSIFYFSSVLMKSMLYDLFNSKNTKIYKEILECSSDLTREELINRYIKNDWRNIAENCFDIRSKELTFVFDTGLAEISFFDNGEIHLEIITSSLEEFKKFQAIKKEVKIKEDTGNVYTILQTKQNLTVKKLTSINTSLEKENYQPNIVEDFKKIVKQVSSTTPSGRLVLIDGQPGTGKTFFVRSLIGTINAKFILVSPSLVQELSGPQLLPLLIKQSTGCDEYGYSEVDKLSGRPLVLVIEDADQCLVPRQSDNISSITTMLNLADGILGESLGIFIICTTNAQKLEMDQAILRPGRLMQRVEINLLNPTQASKIYTRLTKGKEKQFNNNISLAEIYHEAKKENCNVD